MRIIPIVVVSLIIIVGVLIVLVQSNRNYTQEELQVIALNEIPGEIIDVKMELEIEDLAIEYNFYVRDDNNRQREITVSTKTGAITYIEPFEG